MTAILHTTDASSSSSSSSPHLTTTTLSSLPLHKTTTLLDDDFSPVTSPSLSSSPVTPTLSIHPTSLPYTHHHLLSPPTPLLTPSLSPPTPQTAPPTKIFVGGLSWETTETSLRQYFSKFGTITDVLIMRDRVTGHPRGFGFVTFLEKQVALVVAGLRHEVDGRIVEAKVAVPKGEIGAVGGQRIGIVGVGGNVSGSSGVVGGVGVGVGVGGVNGKEGVRRIIVNKIFVGGLPGNCKEYELADYFGRFGKMCEVQVLYDHGTGNSRGFGFVTFDKEESVELVMGFGGRHEILGKFVEVKRAEPRGAMEDRRSVGSASGQMEGGNRDGGGMMGNEGKGGVVTGNARGSVIYGGGMDKRMVDAARVAAALRAEGGRPVVGSAPAAPSPFASISELNNSKKSPPLAYPSAQPSSNPWDDSAQIGKPSIWSSNYWDKMKNWGSEDMVSVLDRVMQGMNINELTEESNPWSSFDANAVGNEHKTRSYSLW